MAGEVFISYRRADAAWARLFHDRLKAEGVDAWYDALVGPGEDWRIETARALEACHVFVLLFSANAAQSSDIAKELAAATLEKKLIVPVRLENIAPKGAFLYELAARNWIDAYDDTEAKLTALAGRLAGLVKNGTQKDGARLFERLEPARNLKRSRIVLPAAIGLVLILACVLTARLLWPAGPARSTAPAAATAALPSPAGISIAVLPFLNLSGDKDQEFFSDGMTEEVTSALAKVPGLTVIGRSSAFQFKGQNRDMRAIGRALGVRNLIEGSVRKDGDQVRITAELVRADDGSQLWSESYDRKLKSIFAVQEDIATAIAGALKVPLGLAPGESLVANRTDDTQSYQDYLRALALFHARKTDDVIAILKGVVSRDPGYAPAWALLAEAYTLPASYAGFDAAIAAGNLDEARRLARLQDTLTGQAAERALRLDPRNPAAYNALAAVESHQGHWAAAEDYSHKALALDGSDASVLYAYGYLLAATGRLKEAMAMQTRIMAVEPFVPAYQSRVADLDWALGNNNAAIKVFEAMAPESRDHLRLAKVLASVGRYGEAVDALRAAKPSGTDTQAQIDSAIGLLRTAPAKAADPAGLPLLPANLSYVYLFVGADARSLDPVKREIAVGYLGGIFRDPWAPASAALRKTEAFKDFVRKAGFDTYWRQRGWPQFCHPLTGSDFACQ